MPTTHEWRLNGPTTHHGLSWRPKWPSLRLLLLSTHCVFTVFLHSLQTILVRGTGQGSSSPLLVCVVWCQLLPIPLVLCQYSKNMLAQQLLVLLSTFLQGAAQHLLSLYPAAPCHLFSHFRLLYPSPRFFSLLHLSCFTPCWTNRFLDFLAYFSTPACVLSLLFRTCSSTSHIFVEHPLVQWFPTVVLPKFREK